MITLHATLERTRAQRIFRLVTPVPPVPAAPSDGTPIAITKATVCTVDDQVFIVLGHGRPVDQPRGRSRDFEVARWDEPDAIPTWVRDLVAGAGLHWGPPEVACAD